MSNTELNSLGFPKSPEQTRVAVAMSGGVDSSVCAAMLHNEGYDVIGITMQLHDNKNEDNPQCSGQDLEDVKRIAKMLGFEHKTLNYKHNFNERIIKEFANSYIRGETPIPCVRCNQTIKFGDMLDFARSLEADCMVTGHYVQRDIDRYERAYLKRGADSIKDQSYFLFATSQEQLDFLRFPLGSWSKEKTREQARKLNLITAEKAESQDICFVPDGNYAKLVETIHPKASKPGKIMHIDGREVGKHKGIIHYTIGQRKGLGIGGGVSENNEPLYVVAINAKKNQIIVGPKKALARDILHIDECNWLFDVDRNKTEVMVKFRSVMNPAPALLQANEEAGTADIFLNQAQYGIATGQAAVCYISDRMIGGGWITGTSSKND